MLLTPGRGKDLMEPTPLRASSIVLCFVPAGQNRKRDLSEHDCHLWGDGLRESRNKRFMACMIIEMRESELKGQLVNYPETSLIKDF